MNYFTPGRWYVQRFSDEVLWFFVQDLTKKGHGRGIGITEYPGSRAFPKAKNQTNWARELWREVPASDVPPRVCEAYHEKISG